MFIKQLSVFIENKEGRLGEVLDVLKKKQVSVISLSLADTSEYGLLRMITNDPQTGSAKGAGICSDALRRPCRQAVPPCRKLAGDFKPCV